MVACYHNGTYSRCAAEPDSVLYLGTDGVYHACHAYVDKVVLKSFGRCVFRQLVVLAVSRKENSQRLIRHFLVAAEYLKPVRLGHYADAALLEHMSAVFQHLVGSTLGVLYIAAVGPMHRVHHLSQRVEGSLCNSRSRSFKLVFFKSALVGVSYQSSLCRLACNGIVGIELCVAAERHSLCKELLIVGVLMNYRHLVLCEGTCLVGADDLCAAQSLNGCKAADNSSAL